MPAPSFSKQQSAGGKSATLRKPSRLRQVLDIMPQTSIGDQDYESSSVVVGTSGSVTYNLGDEIDSFAEALYLGSAEELFGSTGLLARYYSIGKEKLEYLIETESSSQMARSQWQAECRSWDLVQCLYLQRTRESIPELTVNQFSSNTLCEQYYLEISPGASEVRIVLDWLRSGAVLSRMEHIRGNRWLYSKENIRSRKRLGRLSDQDGMISSLDPDAPLRQGKRLDDKDTDFERQLLRSLYGAIRCGNFVGAADLARQAGNHWRAASLQGCIEHLNPSIDTDLAGDAVTEGTVNKALWRRMCYALSRQAGTELYERALYGTMCGDLVSVLPVCTSWEDCLWAHLNNLDQYKTESYLCSTGRLSVDQEFPAPEAPYTTINLILEGLTCHENNGVRLEAVEPMRVIQAHMITNRIDRLVIDIHEQLLAIRNGGLPTVASAPHIIRFMTHFILVLRQMDVTLPEEAVNSILQAYIELLASANHGSAVALYASYLPQDMAIESLARYLLTVEDEDTRIEQLRFALERGLDTGSAILRAVELVFEDVLSDLQVSNTIVDIKQELSAPEERSIRALEWLKLDPNLQLQNVILGNTLFRRLLLAGKISAARVLDSRIPDSSLIPLEMTIEDSSELDHNADVPKMRNAIEYVGYCTLVRALSRYHEWKTLIRNKPQDINGRRDPLGLRQWKSEVARLRLACTITLREVLENHWCEPADLCVMEEDPVFEEMTSLRDMYIPEVVLRLHGVYSAHEGRDIAAAMDLACLVSEKLTGPMQRSGLLKVYVAELGRIGVFLV